jgi:hypothetical protein
MAALDAAILYRRFLSVLIYLGKALVSWNI